VISLPLSALVTVMSGSVFCAAAGAAAIMSPAVAAQSSSIVARDGLIAHRFQLMVRTNSLSWMAHYGQTRTDASTFDE
jgi:hypothetical protein